MSEIAPTPDANDKKDYRKLLNLDAPPVVTEHTMGKLKYTASVGMLPIRDDKGEPEAGLFYTAYAKPDADPTKRPLMFVFNGGPGSSSVWLHLGALGPKRVKLNKDGSLPAPPFELVDCPETWLEHCDLVFIDPVGTGFSRAVKPDLDEKFYGLKGDFESVGEFIRLYLSRNKRWGSPLYMAGESYGTTRAAGLAGYLADFGIAFKGIVLVSSVLQFQTLDFTPGNDTPYVYFLPTYAAAAHYHGKIRKRKNLRAFLHEVEKFATTEYLLALEQGDALPKAARSKIIDKLAGYTGLSKRFLDLTDIRINIHEFCKELLREERKTLGRLDTRFTGYDASLTESSLSNDPAMNAIRAPYTAMINDYLGRVLGYPSDDLYRVIGEGGLDLWRKWDWGSARAGHPDVSISLRDALAKNPHMKVMVASGFYDLATPFAATYYTLEHMKIGPFRKNFVCHEYEAGHMMYIDEKELAKLQKDVAVFLKS